MTHLPNEPEERPGWLYPLILFGITLVIGAIMLAVFLAPDFEEVIAASPTSDADAVQVVIAGRTFDIPTNYIHDSAARGGGTMDRIQLDALLPDLRGFGDDDDDEIRDVTRTSPAITVTLVSGTPELNERDRFERIYARNAASSQAPYEYAGFRVTPLTRESGYAGQSAFTREQDGEFVVLLCSADDRDNEIGGFCQREMAWGQNLTLVYGFRGGHLGQWPALDQAVRALLTRFERKA